MNDDKIISKALGYFAAQAEVNMLTELERVRLYELMHKHLERYLTSMRADVVNGSTPSPIAAFKYPE